MRAILPDAVKAKALATFSRTLTDEAIIYTRAAVNEDGTPSVVVDDFGNPVENENTWTESARYPCRIGRDTRATALVQSGQPKAYDIWILTLPPDAAVNASDQVEVNSARYEITGDVAAGSWAMGRRFNVRQIQAEFPS